MKISLLLNLKILKHYHALILHYDYDFLPLQPFKLTVSLQGENFVFFDDFFVSAEEAREYFFKHYGQLALQAEARILFPPKITQTDILWTHFFDSEGDLLDYAKEIRKYPEIDVLFKKFDISESSIKLYEAVGDLGGHASPKDQVFQVNLSHRLDLPWLRFKE